MEQSWRNFRLLELTCLIPFRLEIYVVVLLLDKKVICGNSGSFYERELMEEYWVLGKSIKKYTANQKNSTNGSI